MILLDTQALIWYLLSPDRLSPKARRLIEREINAGKKLLVSSISIWEVYLLVKKRKIDIKVPLDTWLTKTEQLSFLEFISIDNRIAANSVNLSEPIHKDPADRFIIATARQYSASIVTSDKRIRNYKHVKSIW